MAVNWGTSVQQLPREESLRCVGQLEADPRTGIARIGIAASSAEQASRFLRRWLRARPGRVFGHLLLALAETEQEADAQVTHDRIRHGLTFGLILASRRL
ncbi:hypothetical protein [Deinococcus apachensis]|uniref:hypothetical protein n=1 Tax=Deinococcus apachensis TaxID=309886 RepID=UPI00036FD250|nr:hypothetical protein [Deinococcus apachensis]